ncbi:hypothetical protein [Clostridium chrysemydis]|nr:hypothetical protein [Clostridium chrysemydis]
MNKKQDKINSMQDFINLEKTKNYKKNYENKNKATEIIDNTNNSLK